MKLLVVLSKAYRAVSKCLEEDIRTHGLNPTEFAVLELLHSKGSRPIQAIGSNILISSSSITYVVDKLASKGLLTRKPCQRDKRVAYAALTPAGEALFDKIFPRHALMIKGLFSHLTHEEKSDLIRLLRQTGLLAAGKQQNNKE